MYASLCLAGKLIAAHSAELFPSQVSLGRRKKSCHQGTPSSLTYLLGASPACAVCLLEAISIHGVTGAEQNSEFLLPREISVFQRSVCIPNQASSTQRNSAWTHLKHLDSPQWKTGIWGKKEGEQGGTFGFYSQEISLLEKPYFSLVPVPNCSRANARNSIIYLYSVLLSGSLLYLVFAVLWDQLASSNKNIRRVEVWPREGFQEPFANLLLPTCRAVPRPFHPASKGLEPCGFLNTAAETVWADFGGLSAVSGEKSRNSANFCQFCQMSSVRTVKISLLKDFAARCLSAQRFPFTLLYFFSYKNQLKCFLWGWVKLFTRSGTTEMYALIFQNCQQTKTPLAHLVVAESISGHPVKIAAACNWLHSKQIILNWKASFYERSHENVTVVTVCQSVRWGTKLPNGGSESHLIGTAAITRKIRSVDCSFLGVKLMSTWDRSELGWDAADEMQVYVVMFATPHSLCRHRKGCVIFSDVWGTTQPLLM